MGTSKNTRLTVESGKGLELNGFSIHQQKYPARKVVQPKNEKLLELPLKILPGVNDLACVKCHSTGFENHMLLCDGCDCGFHIFCLDPPLNEVPANDWFCSKCQVNIKTGKHHSKVLKKKQQLTAQKRSISADKKNGRHKRKKILNQLWLQKSRLKQRCEPNSPEHEYSKTDNFDQTSKLEEDTLNPLRRDIYLASNGLFAEELSVDSSFPSFVDPTIGTEESSKLPYAVTEDSIGSHYRVLSSITGLPSDNHSSWGYKKKKNPVLRRLPSFVAENWCDSKNTNKDGHSAATIFDTEITDLLSEVKVAVARRDEVIIKGAKEIWQLHMATSFAYAKEIMSKNHVFCRKLVEPALERLSDEEFANLVECTMRKELHDSQMASLSHSINCYKSCMGKIRHVDSQQRKLAMAWKQDVVSAGKQLGVDLLNAAKRLRMS